jgi:hypothetical protein
MLFFLCFSTGSAQIGVKAGISFTDIIFKTHGQSSYLSCDNKGVIHNLPKLSYQLGLFLPMRLSHKWKVQAELLYANQGIDYSTDYLYDDITYKIDIHYLQLPFIIGYQFSDRPGSSTNLIFGLYVARKLNTNKKIEADGFFRNTEVENINNFDSGGILGMDHSRVYDFGRISFDFRISYSFRDMMKPISDYPQDYSFTPDKYARNVGIILSIGYLFNEESIKNETP